jgi:hypothetical protein
VNPKSRCALLAVYGTSSVASNPLKKILIVVNPASIEVAANDKVKTDRRDSQKQAEQSSRRALV